MIILETDRLLLRTWKEQDLDPMTAINQDPKVCEFLASIGDRASTQAIIENTKRQYDKHGYCLYAVEIGWRLSSRHWKKGYATEAAQAVLHYAFAKLNLNEIVSFTVVNNKASRRIIEKIGLHHDPHDDFDHPKLEKTSPLCRHVLYRFMRDEYLKHVSIKFKH